MKYLKYILILAVFLVLPTVSEAADFYWVGGCSTANWSCDDGATTNWSLSDGGSQHTDIPTSADDVFFTATDASDSTLSANITINSLDMNGYTGTLTHNASIILTIDDENSGGFALRLSASGSYTLGGATNSTITFTDTAGTDNVTTNGKTVGAMTFNGAGGTWQLQDTIAGGVFTLTAGTFDSNNQSMTWSFFAYGGTTARTLTLGSSAISVTSSGTAWSNGTITNLTVTANTAVVTFGSPTTVTFGLKDYNGLSLVYTGAAALLNANGSTFANITHTGTAAKTNTFTLQSSVVVTGTFTVNGNSSVNRILVTSGTLGTASTITAATVTVTNADFRDITGAGAGSWDLSAITGLSGDAGGNSGITFTTGATQYWVGATGSWSTAAEWGTSSGGSGGRVPLPQDDVVFDNGSFNSTSQTASMDMPRMGKSIDWSAYNEGQTPTFTLAVNTTLYGSLTLISGITFNTNTSTTFEGRGAYTLTSAGKTFTNGVTISSFGGSITLQDALNATVVNLTLTDGTFNANNYNVTAGRFTSSSGFTRTLTMGSGTWVVSSTGAVWTLTTAGLTLAADTSTITVSNTTVTAKTFAGGGLTYNNVTVTGQNVIFTGSNTFNILALNTAGQLYGIGTFFTTATTQTMASFTVNSTSTVDRVMASSTTATNATLTKSGGGTVCLDYINIKDLTGSPASTWYAGVNSTDGGDNTNWTFTACPVAGSSGPAGIIYSGSIYSGSI